MRARPTLSRNLPRILLTGILFLLVGCIPAIGDALISEAIKSAFPKRYDPYTTHNIYTQSIRSQLGLVGVRVARAHAGIMEEIPNNLLGQIIHPAQVQADRQLVVLGDANAIDTILEVIVQRVDLQDNRAFFSRIWNTERYSIRMFVDVRLLYPKVHKAIFSFPTFICQRGNDSLEFVENNYLNAIRECEAMLAEKIIDEIFLVDPEILKVSYSVGLMVSSYDNTSLMPKAPLNGALVPSLNPVLQWEPFLQTENVTYDLRIWNARNDVPDLLMYSKKGLDSPSHHIAQLLLPDTAYFWAVRGRYWKNSQRRVTPWSHLSGIGMRKTPDETVPHRNMYRFRTP